MLLAGNVIAHKGDAERVISTVDLDAVLTIVAGLAGSFRDVSRPPPPPGMPTVRTFPRSQADGLRPWLRARIR